MIKLCPRCKSNFNTKITKTIFCSRKCSAIGKGNSRWKGGRRKRKDGYILVYSPDHPYANKNFVLEHRLVMEKYLERYLTPKELVHHLNGDCSDNRIENLELTTNKDHASHHSKLYWTNEKRKEVSEKVKREYLTGKRTPPCNWLGKKHSEETKKKMSLANKGRKFTEEHKANLRKPKRSKLFI